MILIISICLVVLFGPGCQSQDRPILDHWETNAPAFALRITEYQEKQFPLSKFSYVFEARPTGSDKWNEIMTAITDDDVPIPREQVRFVSDRVAFLFMTDKYAITTNGGHSWSIWKANEQISNLGYSGQFFIKEVFVNPEGSGTLDAASRSANKKDVQFRTEDFGHSWVAK
jgi:hypothetical protein